MFDKIEENKRIIISTFIATITCFTVFLYVINIQKEQKTNLSDDASKKELEDLKSYYLRNEESMRLSLDYLRIENKNQEIRLNILEHNLEDLQEQLNKYKKKQK